MNRTLAVAVVLVVMVAAALILAGCGKPKVPENSPPVGMNAPMSHGAANVEAPPAENAAENADQNAAEPAAENAPADATDNAPAAKAPK